MALKGTGRQKGESTYRTFQPLQRDYLDSPKFIRVIFRQFKVLSVSKIFVTFNRRNIFIEIEDALQM